MRMLGKEKNKSMLTFFFNDAFLDAQTPYHIKQIGS